MQIHTSVTSHLKKDYAIVQSENSTTLNDSTTALFEENVNATEVKKLPHISNAAVALKAANAHPHINNFALLILLLPVLLYHLFDE